MRMSINDNVHKRPDRFGRRLRFGKLLRIEVAVRLLWVGEKGHASIHSRWLTIHVRQRRAHFKARDGLVHGGVYVALHVPKVVFDQAGVVSVERVQSARRIR